MPPFGPRRESCGTRWCCRGDRDTNVGTRSCVVEEGQFAKATQGSGSQGAGHKGAGGKPRELRTGEPRPRRRDQRSRPVELASQGGRTKGTYPGGRGELSGALLDLFPTGIDPRRDPDPNLHKGGGIIQDPLRELCGGRAPVAPTPSSAIMGQSWQRREGARTPDNPEVR